METKTHTETDWHDQKRTMLETQMEVIVRLDDAWGYDGDIARIARISTGSQRKGAKADIGLLAHLIRDDHGSPLEMGMVRFEIHAPLFTVAQLLRHRMASYSQVSGRYVEMDLTFYKPLDWKGQGEGNRQMSGEALPDEKQAEANDLYMAAITQAAQSYTALLDTGVSREQARIVLPQALMVKIFCQMNLRSLMNLLTLRMAHDAQEEFQDLAWGMFALTRQRFPVVMDLMMGRNKFAAESRDAYVAFMKQYADELAVEAKAEQFQSDHLANAKKKVGEQ